MGVLHLFSIKYIFYDKIDLRLYFDVTKCMIVFQISLNFDTVK